MTKLGGSGGRQSVVVVAVLAAQLLAVSCGSDSEEGSDSTVPSSLPNSAPDTTSGAPQSSIDNGQTALTSVPGADPTAQSLPPGPPVEDLDQWSNDQLMLSFSGDPSAAEAAAEAMGGEIVLTDEALGFIVASFEVASIDDLAAKRDELRAGGIDASLVSVENDPTT